MDKQASIQYLGHATVLITTEEGNRVLIDPWLEGNPSCPKQFFDPGPIQVICLTHGHSDHVGSTLSIAQKYQAEVFATYELAMLLAADGLSDMQLHPLNKGGSVSVPNTNGVKVHLTNAFHSSSYVTKDKQTHYAGEACGVVLQLESGCSIYHAGDTSLFSDMKLIGEEFALEAALLPIGDHFTMGPQAALKAVQLLQAKLVIPLHFKTFPLLTGSAQEFLAGMEHSKTAVHILEPGEIHKL